jgi:hypothetical protein
VHFDETDGHQACRQARPWIELSRPTARDHAAVTGTAAFGGARLCRRTDRAALHRRLAYRTTFPASRLRVDIGPSRTKWWEPTATRDLLSPPRDEVYFTTSQPEKAD